MVDGLCLCDAPAACGASFPRRWHRAGRVEGGSEGRSIFHVAAPRVTEGVQHIRLSHARKRMPSHVQLDVVPFVIRLDSSQLCQRVRADPDRQPDAHCCRVQAGDSIAAQVAERLSAEDVVLHRFGSCGFRTDGGAGKAAEPTAAAVSAALTASDSADKRAVRHDCAAPLGSLLSCLSHSVKAGFTWFP